MAQTLYRQLIEPLTDFIPSDARLVIVPDKFLNYVPFSALISPKTNKYLVEHHATILAPSAAVFLHCAENAARKRSVQSERLLAIGNPRFDMEAYPNLSNLPNAELEANEIAKLYARHKLLLNTQADEPTVINEMKKADVIHLALHGVTEPLSPLNSFLLLARTDRRAGLDGRIQSHEIGFLKSLPARIVILSACQSGVESYYRGEGMIGFSRSFLSVGVPTVIASFWAVDSSATASLMIKFHQLFKNSNHLPTKALQQAQLSLMKGKQVEFNHPFYWASFSAFGGEIESNNLIKE